MNNGGQLGISEGQVCSDAVSEEPKSADDQHEVIMLSPNQAKKEGNQAEIYVVKSDVVITEMLNVPMTTSSLEPILLLLFRPMTLRQITLCHPQ